MPVTIACAAALLLLLLLLLTTLIHYEALRALDGVVPLLRWPRRSHIVLVIVGLFCAHAIEIVLYAASFFMLVHHATLGYGDIVPDGAIRLLAGTEALNGLLLIGWSSSYAHIAMQRAASDRP